MGVGGGDVGIGVCNGYGDYEEGKKMGTDRFLNTL